MRSLVTGGAGFMGSHIVDALLAAGHQVVVLDDLSGGFRDNVNVKVEALYPASAEHDVEILFSNFKFDYVFHLAAYAAEGLSHFIRSYNYKTNLIASVNLINESIKHNVKCFVFASSIAVYGSGRTPMTEDMDPRPEDPYGISKYAVEMDLKAAHHMFGLNYIVFRPHNVYGERQNIGDPYRNVIGIFMNQIMRGEPCPIFGDGNQTRAFSYISDVASVMARSIHVPEAYNQIFNVGADTPYSVNELLYEVQLAMGANTGVIHHPVRKEVVHAFSDHGKLKKVFHQGFYGIPETSLRVGIGKMAMWAKSVGSRKGRPFTKIEVERGLPESWRNL